jgi:hypothetical protein
MTIDGGALIRREHDDCAVLMPPPLHGEDAALDVQVAAHRAHDLAQAQLGAE